MAFKSHILIDKGGEFMGSSESTPIEVVCWFSVDLGYLQCSTEQRLLGQCIRSVHCSCADSDAV